MLLNPAANEVIGVISSTSGLINRKSSGVTRTAIRVFGVDAWLVTAPDSIQELDGPTSLPLAGPRGCTMQTEGGTKSARGTYRVPDYVIDVLNATAAMKVFPNADPNRIGMWGHSMGGYITLRAMVVDPDIKAGVIWAGVVASYDDLDARWFRSSRGAFLSEYGAPDENPTLWQSISAHYFLDDLSGPLQLHHGTNDTSVPYEFSQTLYAQLIEAGRSAELYLYDGDDHNLANEFIAAMGRSLSFFYFHVKGGE